MTASTVFGLINNTALLLALGLLYDTLLFGKNYGEGLSVSQFLVGVFIGLIGIAVMMTRWELQPGVVFDTRSVLLSVTGLFFGAVPTIMAVFMTAVFRLYSGGMGMWTGVAVIVTSGGIGLMWRHFRQKDLGDVSIGELYLFGVSVHAAMLLWMFLMPWPTALSVLSRIGVPVMLIFPAGTVLLGKLLSGRHARKNVEKKLRESQQELAEIFSMSLDMICIADINTMEFFKVNPAFKRVLGYSENELLKRSFLDFIHPEDIEPTIKIVSDKLKKGENIFGFTNRYRCKDGAYRWLEWVSHPLPERGITFAVAHDITERKLSEEALKDSEKKFKTLFDMSPQSVALTELETGVIVDANNKFFDLFGDTDKEMIGRTSTELSLYSKQDRKRFVDELKKSGEVSGLEVILKTKDGSMLNVLLFATVIQIKGASYILTYLHNITEEKRLEALLRQQQRLESIGTLAGGVAHEINNPINGIMNYAQLIIDKIGANNPPVTEFADEIIHETKRIATIVRNLLTFSREEKEAHSPSGLKDIIDATMSLIQTVFRRDQITLEMDVPEDLPKIKCRSQQIQQVVMNLTTNARDALNEKYPAYDENKLMKISSNLFEKDGRRWIRTTVEDRGIGIDPDVQKRMFDPFYTTKERAVGTGLGLSISYGIVREHRGELTVESEPGQYTRFHVDLPVDNGWQLDG